MKSLILMIICLPLVLFAEEHKYWSYPYPELVDTLQREGKDSILIFSYGSLMDHTSASRTLGAKTLATKRPALAYKIKRLFNRDVAIRPQSKWCEPYHTKARAMLNVMPTEDANDFVNGVLIDLPLDEIPHVLLREEGYDLMPVSVREYNSENYQIAYTFYAPETGPYTSKEIFPRPHYYELTRDAALQYGEHFYELWLETTYLSDGVTPIIEWEAMWMNQEPHTQASCDNKDP